MNFVAWQMLTGDGAKFSTFAGIMNRTTSQIKDVRDARIWVMDAKTQYVDDVGRQAVARSRELYRSGTWRFPLGTGGATAQFAAEAEQSGSAETSPPS